MAKIMFSHDAALTCLSLHDNKFIKRSDEALYPQKFDVISNIACEWSMKWFYVAHAANALGQMPYFYV